MDEGNFTIASDSSEQHHWLLDGFSEDSGLGEEFQIEGFSMPAFIGTLFTTVIFALLIGKLVLAIFNRWRQGHQIHPALAENVNEFRENEEQRNRERTEAARRRIEEVRQLNEHECPICLQQASFPAMSDCGHVFCCQCIIGYWRHSKPIVRPVDCAVCRTRIHMMLPLQWPTRNQESPPDEELNDKIHENNMCLDDYNRRFSTDRSILDYVFDVPVLVPYLFRNFMNNDIFNIVHQIRIGVVVLSLALYVFLPSDIIPESIYGIVGFLDDCFFVFVLLMLLIRILRDHMAQRGNPPRNEGIIFQIED